MPNRDNIRKWVDALRSGEFEQGRSCLKLEEGGKTKYCCLGVVCDLMEREGLDPGLHQWVVPHSERGAVAWFNSPEGGGTLPPAAREWLGIETENPFLTIPPGAEGLMPRKRQAAEMNDTDRATFGQIADAIEYTFLREEEGQ